MISEPRYAITKEYILSKVTEQQIFEKYLGISIEEKLDGRLFRNPLRVDGYPTANIKLVNNNLRFRDWSEIKGYSCFDLVMKIANCDYTEALILIAHHFSLLKESEDRELQYILEPRKIIELTVSTSKKKEIRIKRKEWSIKELLYWKQYGLEIEDLIDVFPIKCYWINEDKFVPSGLTFAYHFGDYNYKLYFPEAKKGQLRFLHNSSTILQGERNLQYNKSVLLLTSSYKDVLLLNKIAKLHGLDYESCATMSETIPINKEKLQSLREKYDYVILYYNNDEQGIKSATQQAEEYNLLNFWNPKGLPKDITDVCKIQGFEAAVKLVKELVEEYFLPF